MVALIYYRKSLRFMLPAASLVSFSRVYNGVHYPSDVLAGAVIGAGNAAATLWVLESLWQWCGPKWFAAASRAMPSLLAPSTRPQEGEPPRTT
jgi:membrane-associated phospholipid phosphatase